jgi:transposase
MAKRYELPDATWELIADLVSPAQKMGRPRSDDRLMLNGIFWVLCSGAAWRDLPERFGPKKRGQIYLNPHLLPASQTSHANSAFPEAG